MKTYSAFVRALHNRSLTRLVAMYLHFSHAVPYRAFYDRLIEGHFGPSRLYERLIGHFRAFLADEDAFEDLPIERLTPDPLCLEASRWLFVHLCRDFDRHFDEMGAFLVGAFPAATLLQSAIDYQRDLVVLPNFDCRVGKSFPTDRDWIRYFERARLLTGYEPLGEPEPAPGAVVVVADASAELDWARKGYRDRWLAWIDYTREMQRTLKVNFQELRLETAD